MDEINKFIQTIVWPAIIFAFWLYNRKEIRNIIPRIKRANPTSFEVEAADQQAEDKQIERPDAPVDTISTHKPELRPSILLIKNAIEQDLMRVPKDERETQLLIALSEARLTVHFERVYRVIFGSQIKALRHLSTLRATRAEAMDFYAKVQSEYPDFYDKFEFEQWVGFLLNQKLIEEHEDIFKITDIGRDFLMYLTQHSINDAKPG